MILLYGDIAEGSLEVKLSAIWRDGKVEVGTVREENRRDGTRGKEATRAILCRNLMGKCQGPRLRPLREPGQSKCTWTFHTNHFVLEFTRKMPEPRWSRSSTGLYSSHVFRHYSMVHEFTCQLIPNSGSGVGSKGEALYPARGVSPILAVSFWNA